MHHLKKNETIIGNTMCRKPPLKISRSIDIIVDCIIHHASSMRVGARQNSFALNLVKTSLIFQTYKEIGSGLVLKEIKLVPKSYQWDNFNNYAFGFFWYTCKNKCAKMCTWRDRSPIQFSQNYEKMITYNSIHLMHPNNLWKYIIHSFSYHHNSFLKEWPFVLQKRIK